MQETLEAIASVLENDATLQSLGVLPTSIVDESNLVAGKATYPAVVITSQGDKPYSYCTPHILVGAWTIRVFDQGNGYYRINKICERIKALFHRQTLTVVGQYLGVMDVNWAWNTPQYYDNRFQAENRGVRFHITSGDFNPIFNQ